MFPPEVRRRPRTLSDFRLFLSRLPLPGPLLDNCQGRDYSCTAMRHTLTRGIRSRHHAPSARGFVTVLCFGLWLSLVCASVPARATTDSAKAAAATADTTSSPQATAPVPVPKPQKIMIVGDSFAVGLGITMGQSLRAQKGVALSSRGKVSSGLNSPRFYDWEKALNDFLAAERPQNLVVMLGGNDAKNGPGTPEWGQDYAAKAKRLLDIAAAYGAKVFWVGLPPMREKAFSQRAWVANQAVRSACLAAKDCRFIDSWDLFADAAGNFCAKKPVGGKNKALRGKDGVHFTPTGCKLLTDRIASGLSAPSP